MPNDYGTLPTENIGIFWGATVFSAFLANVTKTLCEAGESGYEPTSRYFAKGCLFHWETARALRTKHTPNKLQAILTGVLACIGGTVLSSGENEREALPIIGRCNKK